jgi:hypothetical protein
LAFWFGGHKQPLQFCQRHCWKNQTLSCLIGISLAVLEFDYRGWATVSKSGGREVFGGLKMVVFGGF